MLFWSKRSVPENNSGREFCWRYVIGQHTLSPVFVQKRPGAPDYGYFALLPPFFGHFMFLSVELLEHTRTDPENNYSKQSHVEIDKFKTESRGDWQNISLNNLLYKVNTSARTTRSITYNQVSTGVCYHYRFTHSEKPETLRV